MNLAMDSSAASDSGLACVPAGGSSHPESTTGTLPSQTLSLRSKLCPPQQPWARSGSIQKLLCLSHVFRRAVRTAWQGLAGTGHSPAWARSCRMYSWFRAFFLGLFLGNQPLRNVC